MKIQDGSVKVLVANYSADVNNPLYVAIGYKFRESIYTIGDAVQLVQTLNQTHGWHFRNRQVVINGATYQIAEIYEEEKPLRDIYQMEIVTDMNLIGKLNQYCLPIETLGISGQLTTYTKQVQQPQQVQQNTGHPRMGGWDKTIPELIENMNTQNQDTSTISSADVDRLKQRYRQYLTEEELSKFGDLNSLSDQELEALEILYENRKGEAIQKQLVKYELPSELSNYNLIYREEVLGKSIMPKEGQTEDDVNRIKHELGLRAVVDAMVQLPMAEVIESGEDDITSSFRFLKEPIDRVFKMAYDKSSNAYVSAEIEAQNEFKMLSGIIIRQILTKYGNYTNFINEFVKIENNADILPPSTVEFMGISVNYRIVKFFNNYSGYTIGFVTDIGEGEGEYVFLLGLFHVVSVFASEGRLMDGQTFTSAFNYLVEPYCKEIGLTGLNYSKMHLTGHEVTPIHCKLLMTCKDEGVFNYIFQYIRSDGLERYFPIQNGHLINKIFGARYVLIGDNFRINYLGDSLAVVPTASIPYATAESFYQFFDEKANQIQDPFPSYYALLDVESINAIDNAMYKKVIQSYDELLEKTKNLGYIWDEALTLEAMDSVYGDVGGGSQTMQTPQQTQPIHNQTPGGVEVVDIFASQPQQIFNEPQSQSQPQATEPTEPTEPEKDENGFIKNPDFRDTEHIESIIDNIRRLCTVNPLAEDIITEYLISHKTVIHRVGESIGVQMSYTTNPERTDNQLDRYEIVTSAVERVVQGLGIGSKAPDGQHSTRILNGTIHELNEVFNSLDEKDKLRMEKMIKSVIEVFKI